MPSALETILESHILARLLAGSDLVVDMTKVRRAHRTLIPELEDGSPRDFAVHLVDGDDDERFGRAPGGHCGLRRSGFMVSLFARSDSGPTVLDDLKVEVNDRMESTSAAPYPAGVIVKQGRIRLDVEDANADAIRINMEYTVEYQTASEWSLRAP